MVECSLYRTNCDDDLPLCRCPNCQGFLPRDFPLDKQFLCRKCGAVLETIEGEYKGEGQICIVPELAIKISVEMPPPRRPRRRRKKIEKWAMGGGLFGPQESYRSFSRRVWRDKDGEFIEVDGERLDITDSRIHLIHGVDSDV